MSCANSLEVAVVFAVGDCTAHPAHNDARQRSLCGVTSTSEEWRRRLTGRRFRHSIANPGPAVIITATVSTTVVTGVHNMSLFFSAVACTKSHTTFHISRATGCRRRQPNVPCMPPDSGARPMKSGVTNTAACCVAGSPTSAIGRLREALHQSRAHCGANAWRRWISAPAVGFCRAICEAPNESVLRLSAYRTAGMICGYVHQYRVVLS